MYKHILLAVLIGMVSAENHIVASYNGMATPVAVSNLFSFSYMYEFDVFYGTGYTGGPYTASDAPSAGYSYEKYFLLFNSFARAGVTLEFFGIY